MAFVIRMRKHEADIFAAARAFDAEYLVAREALFQGVGEEAARAAPCATKAVAARQPCLATQVALREGAG